MCERENERVVFLCVVLTSFALHVSAGLCVVQFSAPVDVSCKLLRLISRPPVLKVLRRVGRFYRSCGHVLYDVCLAVAPR